MASKTRKLKIIRKRKVAARGTKRKAKLRTKGSTRTDLELFGS
jgi:hypothetical protein